MRVKMLLLWMLFKLGFQDMHCMRLNKPHKAFRSETTHEPRHEFSNNVAFATSKASDQPAHTRSLIKTYACRLNII